MAPPTGSSSDATWLAKALVLLIALAAVTAFGVSRDRLAGLRGFNPDEFEHLHFSWLTSQGEVAYRDYFDHHTPLLHLAFSGWLKRGDFTGREGAAKAMADGRALSLWCTLLALTTTGALVAWRTGPFGTLILVALLCSSANFIAKSLEFRPDVPAMMFLALALAFHAKRLVMWVGVASGMALLCTPKSVFAIVGLLISLVGSGDRVKEGGARAGALWARPWTSASRDDRLAGSGGRPFWGGAVRPD